VQISFKKRKTGRKVPFQKGVSASLPGKKKRKGSRLWAQKTTIKGLGLGKRKRGERKGPIRYREKERKKHPLRYLGKGKRERGKTELFPFNTARAKGGKGKRTDDFCVGTGRGGGGGGDRDNA